MKAIINFVYRYLMVVTTFFAWHWLTDASASFGQGLLFGLLYIAVALAIIIGTILLALLLAHSNEERKSLLQLLTDPPKKKEEGLLNERD